MKARVDFDGGGQAPGPTVAAAIVELDDGQVFEVTRTYPDGTHNTAEYNALNLGLEKAHSLGAKRVEIRGDSKLVVEQVNGRWKVKDGRLRGLHRHARARLDLFDDWEVKHVPREQNKRADELGRRAAALLD